MAGLWHNKEIAAVVAELGTTAQGLSGDESARRLRDEGPNALPEAKADGLPIIFLRQFKSPLIYLLLVASGVMFFMRHMVDGYIILAIPIFNAIIGTIQEGKAQNTLRALRQYVTTNATVRRDDQELVITDRDVVRGDIIVLQEGEKVPADARVMNATGLKIDESSLTGESTPVDKIADRIVREKLAAPEQRNMVFKGTNVVSGSGVAAVVATGSGTIIGQIAREISVIDSEIPLKANIRYLSRVIVGIVGVVSILLFGLGLLRGQDFATIFSTVVSLAVSVVPEGLPVVITLVLATGVWRMSKRNALVKKLQAVEALGQARIIAVDKTGTITKNELVMCAVWTNDALFSVSGSGYDPHGAVERDGVVVDAGQHPEILYVGRVAALSANARTVYANAEQRWRVIGDPTEAAIRVFGEKVGMHKGRLVAETPLVAEIPFDYTLKYHASVYQTGQQSLLVVTGAPEVILATCTHIRRGGKKYLLKDADRARLLEVLADMSERGLRVVGGAVREQFADALTPEAVRELTFVGFFGLQDTLRPEVADAMARAIAAGVRVVMITGDHRLTARAIARDAGIWHEGDTVITGEDMDAMSDVALAEQLGTTSVFARVTPEHKLRIINAYKHRGEIIAMTGDGVNDAPPLVAADLGVAMGKIGTEVAKEAADIVLLDDNFGSIVSAIEEGRNIYITIKKVILYLFSTSVGEVLVITAALLLGYPLPLVATQIIWLNFVTDGFLVIALAMEPKEEGLLRGTFAKPKRYLVDGLMAQRMAVMAVPMMVGTLVLFGQYFGDNLEKAWTISLTTLAVFQWFNAWNCRSDRVSIFRMNPLTNLWLIGATGLVIVLQMLAVYVPVFQRVLRTVPLSLSEWGMIVAVSLSIIAAEETRKFFYRLAMRRRAA